MTSFLARSISIAKWNARTNIAEHSVPSDGVTADMRTSSNILSFWVYDPTKERSLEDVALALASTRDQIQRLDLVWIDEEQIARMGLACEATRGETRAKHLEDHHRDVIGMDLLRLVRLARSIAKAVRNGQTKRFTERQIQELLIQAAKDKRIFPDDLSRSVAARVRAAIAE